jgi:broad specificity phosphatase PhoE
LLTLYITRHGETEWNTEKRMQGWRDSNLTNKGKEHATRLGNRLKEVEFEAIYSSSSKRTEMTADLIRGNHEVPIILDERLREINMGIWEGETVSHIQANHPDEFHSFWNTPHLYQPLGGERFDEVRNRVLNCISSIRDIHDSGNILIVTHSVVIKTLLAYFKNLPLERLWEPPFIHDTSLTVVELWEEGSRIVLEGDLSHWEKSS